MSAQTIDTVDLERYPIDDLDGPAGRALVARCRAELAAVGACDLPGFLERRAIEQIVAEIPRGARRLTGPRRPTTSSSRAGRRSSPTTTLSGCRCAPRSR